MKNWIERLRVATIWYLIMDFSLLMFLKFNPEYFWYLPEIVQENWSFILGLFPPLFAGVAMIVIYCLYDWERNKDK